MRVLIVEDNPRVAGFVKSALSEQGYAVDVAENGEDGLHFALSSNYDVGILDLGLPLLDGCEVLTRLRASGSCLPVLALTARDSVTERVQGLDAGADDYLTKPFAIAELLARVRALTRRQESHPGTTLSAGNVTLDPLKRRVECAGKTIDLTPREFAILEYFLRNAGNVLSRTMIIENVWDCQLEHMSNVIDVHVRRIRQKLGDPQGETTLTTVRGVGYRFGSDD